MLYDWLYVVYSSDYSFLNIAWAKLLSMIFILLTGYQFWFCGMILNGELYKKSGREVLREGIFENKNIIFLINYATYYLTFYCFKYVP